MRSPNRLDWLVWAITELAFGDANGPQERLKLIDRLTPALAFKAPGFP